MINTTRLKLIPGTVELARAEIHDRAGFARMLDARVPENWPPASLADALPLFLGWLEEAPDNAGWFGWYAVTVEKTPVLIGSGGFMGRPTDGVIDMGYSVLSQFEGRGYATEMVGGLVRWASGQTGVRRIAAETEWANPGSVRVLEKSGFVAAGPARDPEGTRFEYAVA